METLALIAHDHKKEELLNFAQHHRTLLVRYRLIATNHTGILLRQQAGLDVETLLSGPLGGDTQIAARVAEGQVRAVFFLVDPLTSQGHDPDVRAVLRVCNVHNVPLATNVATATAIMAMLADEQNIQRSTIMEWQFELVAGPFGITEGPAWDGTGLLFTNISNNRILRYDPQTGEISEFRSGTNGGNGTMFDQQGRYYCCEGKGRRVVRYNPDGSTDVVADSFEGKRLNSPNDLAIDALGRIWFTDPRYGDDRADMELDHESVFRCDPQPDGSWNIMRMTYDTNRPNGLLITPDMSTLYVAQSAYGEGQLRELRAYPIKTDGTLGAYQVLHNFYPHRGIDGMCLDSTGNIIASAGWDTSGPGPMIYVFASNGRVLATHPLQHGPTNCTFGDADLRTLYVTTLAGHLYRARTDLMGLPQF